MSDGSTVIFDNTSDNYAFIQLVGSSGDLKFNANNVERMRFTPSANEQDIRINVYHFGKDSNNLSPGLVINASIADVDDPTKKVQVFRSNVNVNGDTNVDSASVFVATGPIGQGDDVFKKYYGFSAQSSVATSSASENAYGFYSNLDANDEKNYNFYSEGSAANFFASSTFIGGDPADGDLVNGSKIALLSNGEGIFKGGIDLIGGGPNVSNGFTGSSGERIGIQADDRVIGSFSPRYGLASEATFVDGDDLPSSSNLSAQLRVSPGASLKSHRCLQAVIGSVEYGTVEEINGYRFDGTFEDKAPRVYGIYSGMNGGQVDEFGNQVNQNFAMVLAGNAPSFSAGNVHVGGTMSRNTLSLWKESLTEEEIEQFDAGTLVAPANVTTPGDGTYVRQWYYNQQDAETQALLDSGEIEYPNTLSASTFVDNFNINDTTNITLSNGGTGIFKGGVGVEGGNVGVVPTGIYALERTLNLSQQGIDVLKLWYDPDTGTKAASINQYLDPNIGLNLNSAPNVFQPDGAGSQTATRLGIDINEIAKSVYVVEGRVSSVPDNASIEGLTMFISSPLSGDTNLAKAPALNQNVLYSALRAGTQNPVANRTYGFYSNLINNTDSNKSVHQLYLDGDASSWHRADFHVGGSNSDLNGGSSLVSILQNGGIRIQKGGTQQSVGTGLYSNANNYLAFATNSKLRYYVNDAGSTDIIMSDRAESANGFRFIGTLEDHSKSIIMGQSSPSAPVTGGNLENVTHWLATTQTSMGTDKWVDSGTTHTGFEAKSAIFGAENNYGFYSDLNSTSPGANHHNFYANGSAPNYFKGLVKTRDGISLDGNSNYDIASLGTGLIARDNKLILRHNFGNMVEVLNPSGSFRSYNFGGGADSNIGFVMKVFTYSICTR